LCLLKIAGLSGKSKDMVSGVNTTMPKQPKTGKTPLKKDAMTQNNPPDASDKRTGERHPGEIRRKMLRNLVCRLMMLTEWRRQRGVQLLVNQKLKRELNFSDICLHILQAHCFLTLNQKVSY
jgi:hypothetical protein